MLKLIHEIEIGGMNTPPQYIYIETDENIEISIGKQESNTDQTTITHIATIDTDIGITPDLIISRGVYE
jgi:hypothetical protein